MPIEESRVKVLEIGHAQLENRQNDLTAQQINANKELIEIGKSLAETLVQLKDNVSHVNQFEQTIRNVDDNVETILLALERGPMERHDEIQKQLAPILRTIQEHDKRFMISADKVKTDLRREVRTNAILSWVFFIFLTSSLATLAGYIYITDKDGCEAGLKSNEQDIKENRMNIRIIDDQAHTHESHLMRGE